MSIERNRYLVEKLQKGTITILEQREIVSIIMDKYRPHKQENYLYDPEEMDTVYLTKSYNALYKAKLDVGDPIAYGCNRGHYALLDYYRKVSSEKLILQCTVCGNQMTYDRRNKKCRKCHSTELVGIEKYESISDKHNFSVNSSIEDDFEKQELIETLIEKVRENKILAEKYKLLAEEAIKNQEDLRTLLRNNIKNKKTRKQIFDVVKDIVSSVLTSQPLTV